MCTFIVIPLQISAERMIVRPPNANSTLFVNSFGIGSGTSGFSCLCGGGECCWSVHTLAMANLIEKTLGKALGAIFKNFSPDKLEMVALSRTPSALMTPGRASRRTSCAASAS